jgi:hypothetical protein
MRWPFCILVWVIVAVITTAASSASSPRSDPAGRAIAKRIQSHLTAAGYSIEGVPFLVSAIPLHGVPVTHLAARPVAAPKQLVFRVEAEYASRHSFSLVISVEPSAAAAALRTTHVVMDCNATHCPPRTAT